MSEAKVAVLKIYTRNVITKQKFKMLNVVVHKFCIKLYTLNTNLHKKNYRNFIDYQKSLFRGKWVGRGGNLPALSDIF